MTTKQIVFNPNFHKDVNEIFNLSLSSNEINKIVKNATANSPLTTDEKKAGVLSLDKKLKTFIDRVEFIKHLKILSDNAKKQNFLIDQHEVVGVDWDINALRLYLSLTCIDIFFDANNHKDHFEIVFNNISQPLETLLLNNLKIIENGNELLNRTEFSLFFYNIRNSYTHAGIRFHSDGTSMFTLNQDFVVGNAKNKTTKALQIKKGFDLIEFILNVSIENAKKKFNF